MSPHSEEGGAMTTLPPQHNQSSSGAHRDDATTPPCHPNHDTNLTSSSVHSQHSQSSQPLSRTLPWWYPTWPHPWYHGNGEALAWALDSIGRSVVFIGSAAFLGTALLRLAKQAAGCETAVDPETDKVPKCNERIYGLRPSSLLTTYTIVVGLTSATLMPVVGAMIDTTPHRLQIGRISTIIFCILLIPQIAISEHTWFAVAMIQLVIAIIGWCQTLATYAYLPELTTDERVLNQYSQSFTTVSFTAMVLYLGFVVGVSSIVWGESGSGDDEDTENDIAIARLGQVVALIIATPLLYTAWYQLFQPRAAVRTRNVNTPLWKEGFQQVGRTIRHISIHWRAVKWFYISVAFIDAAVNSLATVAITFLTDTLAFSTQENGIAVLCLLLGSIPGGITGGVVAARLTPLVSSLFATALLLGNTIAFAMVLTGPNQQLETYLLAAVWGCGTGWKWTNDRLIASTIIPVGQDTELMGTFLFAGQCLTWLPPLLYTALNEAGVNPQFSLCSLGIWFFLGIAAIAKVGDYTTAVRAAGRGYVLDGEEELSVRESASGTPSTMIPSVVPLEHAENKDIVRGSSLDDSRTVELSAVKNP